MAKLREDYNPDTLILALVRCIESTFVERRRIELGRHRTRGSRPR